MLIRKADTNDVPSITEIYNEAILNTTATFDTELKTTEDRMEWLARHSDKYPVLVAVENGQVIAWASMSQWSDRCAYDDTAEISIYVHPAYHNRGIGKQLLKEIVEDGRKGGLHCVLSRITQGNEKSIHLHRQVGFTMIGTMKEVGKKFGKILDVHMMQLLYNS
jgi:phosphinothricin acetyltransferase